MASYLSYIVGKVVPGARSPFSDLAYEVLEPIPNKNLTSVWVMHHGVKKSDKTPVTIFVYDASKHPPNNTALARNAFKRWKTLRHPLLLMPYLDGIESDELLVIVTNHVRPLWADDVRREVIANEQLAFLGLFHILKSLAFINEVGGLVHGAVCLPNIFVNDAGEFKLGGFDLLAPITDTENHLMRSFGVLSGLRKYLPPEIASESDWQKIRAGQSWATDMWFYGCFMYELFNGSFSNADELKSKSDIPVSLFLAYKDLLKASASQRPSPTAFLERLSASGLPFSSPLVQTAEHVASMSLKSSADNEAFLRRLPTLLPTFPLCYRKHRLLPELITSLEFGGVSGDASGGGAGRIALSALNVILSMDTADHVDGGAQQAQAQMDPRVVDVVVKLLSSGDRALRGGVVDGLSKWIGRVSDKIVSERIFPVLARGFLDPAPAIRDQTVKTMMVIAPKLSASIVNGDLLKYFAKCQTDEEPGIRTNTTICLGKIAEYISPATRKKILASAFLRALRDPFPPAREAGLKALIATIETYFAEDIAARVIPAISPLMVDPEASVRTLAGKACGLFVKQMESAVYENPAIVSGAASAAGQAGNQHEDGWGSWAVNSLTKKLVGVEVSDRPADKPADKPVATTNRPTAAPTSTSTASTAAAPRRSEPVGGAPSLLDDPIPPPMRATAPSAGMSLTSGASRTASSASTSSQNSGWDDIDASMFGDIAPLSSLGAPAAAPMGMPAASGQWGHLEDEDDLFALSQPFDVPAAKPRASAAASAAPASSRAPAVVSSLGAPKPAAATADEAKRREDRRLQRSRLPRAPPSGSSAAPAAPSLI